MFFSHYVQVIGSKYGISRQLGLTRVVILLGKYDIEERGKKGLMEPCTVLMKSSRL